MLTLSIVPLSPSWPWSIPDRAFPLATKSRNPNLPRPLAHLLPPTCLVDSRQSRRCQFPCLSQCPFCYHTFETPKPSRHTLISSYATRLCPPRELSVQQPSGLANRQAFRRLLFYAVVMSILPIDKFRRQSLVSFYDVANSTLSFSTSLTHPCRHPCHPVPALANRRSSHPQSSPRATEGGMAI